jgi:hypothetical protein
MSIRGALITKSAAQTGLNVTGGAFPTFNTTVYDTDSIVQSSQFFQIPAGLNNKYGIFTLSLSLSSVTSGDSYQSWISQNSGGTLFVGTTWKGVPILGQAISGNGQATTSAWLNLSTGPVLLTTSDRYDGLFQCLTDTSITIEQESSFGLIVLETMAFGYCTAKLNANLTGVDYSTPTAIAWNGTDILDSAGIHDPSSNNTKFIVPSSLNGRYMVVGANIWASSVTASNGFAVAIRKNGSLTYTGMGGNSNRSPTFTTQAAANCKTQAIAVSTGDEFETLVYSADTSIDISAARSNMYCYVVA